MMQSTSSVKNKARKLYLDPTQHCSGRALKPFYNSLIEKRKINKKVTWSEFQTYFQDWPPYIKFIELNLMKAADPLKNYSEVVFLKAKEELPLYRPFT